MKRLVAASVAWIVIGSGLMSAKVIARVDGYPVTERAANDFLKIVTKGKLKFHQLRPKDKRDVVKRIAVDALLIGKAKKGTTTVERNQVIVNYWLAKKIKNTAISDEEVKKAYTSNKKLFKDKQGQVQAFDKVKDMIAVSLKQKKYVAQLMEQAKITMGKKVIQYPKKKKSSKKSGKRNSTASKGKTKTYVVKSGNTLSGIAHKYHISIRELKDLNGMDDKATLKIGQKLQVPSK